jgi:hypothetical protein
MIAIFMNTMEDTNTFSPLFKGIDGTLLTNPTRAEVIKVLEDNPTDTLMCLGHGSSTGLFSENFSDGPVVDSSMVHLLKDREMIGIWCYASEFARMHNLKGFFTYMFISNLEEAKCHGMSAGVTDEMIYEENIRFSNYINELITNKTPLENWVDALYENCNHELPFVEFNYSRLSYFDGTDSTPPVSILDEESIWDFGPLLCFAEITKITDYLCEKYGEDGDANVDSLTDEEFMALSSYQYTIDEYVWAFNEGLPPTNNEFYLRSISQ